MKFHRGYYIDWKHPGTVTAGFANVTLYVAWWRVLLIRLFGKRGA